MSTYTVTTNFGSKDGLPAGSPDKVIKGSEFTVEFNNIATAVNSKANSSTVTALSSEVSALDTSLTTLSSDVTDIESDVTVASAAITVLSDLSVNKNGDTMEGALNFGDNVKINMGADNDLQMYHTGVHSIIEDQGTGNLFLRSNGSGVAVATASNVIMAEFVNGGACNLYHDGSKKLATISTGVDITGEAKTDSLLVGTDTSITNCKLRVDSAVMLDGSIHYNKSYNLVDTDGEAVAGLGANFNGASCVFEFTGGGGNTGAFHIIFSCSATASAWNVDKQTVLASDNLDVEYSGGVFTFKSKSGTATFTPRIRVVAYGNAIATSYI